MKKIKILFLTSILLISIFYISCKEKQNDSKKTLTLVMAENNPPGSIVWEMDNVFKSKVEELSDGNIKIELNHSGSLGDEVDLLNIMRKPNSPVHLIRVSTFSLRNIGNEKASLLSIPFTFKDKDHFWRFANSSLAKEIIDEPYEKKLGLKGLFYGEEGFRHFFSTRPLNSIEDFEGLKMRVSSDKSMQDLADCLKTQKVENIEIYSLYSAMSIGAVDAAEQPIVNYLANKLNIIAPYMILDGHSLGTIEVLITSEIWDSLTDAQREILLTAGKAAQEYCKNASKEAEDNAKAKLLEKNTKLVPVDNTTPWEAACKDIIEEKSKDYKALYQKILDLSK